MLKKFICSILSLILIFPTVTFVSAAEIGTTVTDIALLDACYVRNGTSHRNVVQGGSSLVVEQDVNSKRQSYVKFDFGPYMDTLDYITDIRFSLTPYNGSGDRNYTLAILPDNMESWSSSTLTFSMAETAGMTSESAGELLCTTSVTANTETTSADISTAVKNHLKNNTSNTVVAFKVNTSINGAWVVNGLGSAKAPKLTITVEIDGSDIVRNIYDGLTFEDINECTSDAVTTNFKLPATGSYGTTITWSADNADVVDSQSGIITRPMWNEGNKNATLTARIQNGDFYLDKSFSFTVPESNVYPDNMVLEEYCYATDSTYVRRGKTDIYKGSLVLDSRNKDRMGYVKFDFTGFDEYLEKANSMQLRLDTSTDVISTDNDNFVVYVIPENLEDIDTSTMTYSIANEKGLINYEDNLVWMQDGLRASNTYYSGDILSAIKKNIDEGDDSVVWLKVASTRGVGYTMYGASAADTFKPALIIKYPKPASELDYYDLKIPTVADSDVTLPAIGQFGSEITWATSNESLISSDGTVSVAIADEDYSKEDSKATLTATISADGESLTKTFEVRVRRSGVIDAIADATITSDGVSADDTSISVGGTAGRISLLRFDVQDTLAQIKNSRKTVLKLYGSAEYANKNLTLVPVTNENICSNGFESLSYSDVQNIINTANAFNAYANFEDNSYVTFDVTEYMYSLTEGNAVFVLCTDDPQMIMESLEGALGKEPKLIVSPIEYTDEYAAQTVADEIDFSDISTETPELIRKNLTLPTSGRFGSTISWHSTNEAVVASDGTVTRAAEDTSLTLTAKVTVGEATVTKTFNINVRKAETDLEYATSIAKTLAPDKNILTGSITLKGENLPDGAVASWESSEPYEAKVNGFTLELTRPNSADLPVTLTVSVTYNGQTAKESFNVTLVRSANKNLLRNRKITEGDADAEKAIDEDIDTIWNISNSSLTVNLNSPKVISGMTLVPEISSFSGLTISVSDDMYQWKSVYSGGNFEAGKLNYITFSPIAYGTYLKFDFPSDAKAVSFIGAYSFVDGEDSDVFASVTVPSEATSDFELIQNIYGNSVQWESSSTAIKIDGYTAKVSRGSSSKNVTLTAKVIINDESHTKSYVVYVPASKTGSVGGGGGGSSFGGGSGIIASPSVGTQTSQTQPTIKDKFTDLASAAWAADYINYLADKGIVNGKADGIFAPGDSLTREEMAKIIVLAFNLPQSAGADVFADVVPGSWYEAYVASIYENGIAQGVGDGKFGTGLAITRQDAFTMIANVLGLNTNLKSDQSSGFGDDGDIADYARGSINALKDIGIVGGDNNGNVNPTAGITRAEIAKVICLAISNK